LHIVHLSPAVSGDDSVLDQARVFSSNPVEVRNPAHHGVAPESAAQAVQRVARVLSPPGDASIVAVSGALGLSVRTLQRRLAIEGEAYSDLIKGVKRELARRHLNKVAPGWDTRSSAVPAPGSAFR
jgi:AraC-like DNA-binding protein